MIISNIDNKDYERKAKDYIKNQEKVKEAYRLLAESQGGYLDHDQKTAMLQAERNIESAKEIEIFYRMYGRYVEIPCTDKFTMYIEPALGGDNTCVRAEFVMTSESQLPATKVAGLHDSAGRCSPPGHRHATYPDIARLTELPQKRCRGRPVRGRFPSELPC